MIADSADREPQFDHLELDPRLAPADSYRRLREAHPVAISERHGGFTVLSRHSQVSEAAHLFESFSSRSVSIPADRRGRVPIMLDPPEHTPIRAPLTAFFSHKRIGALEPQIRDVVTRLVDSLPVSGPFDLSRELSQRLPTELVLDLVGIPRPDGARMSEWIDLLVYQTDPDPMRARSAALALHAYIHGIVDGSRPAAATDHLLGHLQDARTAGAPLSSGQIANILVTHLYAGLSPTTFLINGALLLLESQPEIRDHLARRPDLIPSAVEELLRFCSPVRSIGRVVNHDCEFFGHRFRTGEQVLLHWGAANRDDEVFPDADRLDVDRSPNRHLAFGAGPHRCPGAGLARLILRVVLEIVPERTPDLRIPDLSAIGWQTGHAYGINRLPVEYPSRPRV